VTVGSHVFTTTAPASAGPLAAGASIPVIVTVTVPPGTPVDVSDTVTITFTSQGDSNRSASTMLTTVAGYRRLYLPLIAR